MFDRLDENDDGLFYIAPRKLVHIDDGAIAAAGQCMAKTFASNGLLLDLMSSWRSHLPEALVKQKLFGLGMNAEEMASNPDLDEYIVHNLNADSQLPFPDAYLDGVVVTVSIQYLIKPVEVFAEVNRVLKIGCPFLVLYSNRMFPTKAVRVWQMLRDKGRAELVQAYFHQAGGYAEAVFEDWSPNPGTSDPLFAVSARKQQRAGTTA
jgi:SAM-dependent methyltransferase